MTHVASIVVLFAPAWLISQPAEPVGSLPGVIARVRPVSTHVPIGQPVWVHFLLENTTDKPITLTVPQAEPEIPPAEMGLPLSHVYSSGGSAGVTVSTESGRRWELPVGYRATPQAPILLLAPRSMVGLRLDLRDHFPSVRGAGTYRIAWKPYGGATAGETATINVAPLKQVEITTDDGNMTLRMLYDDAPETVANFLELAKSGFYSGKAFHRVEPGYMLQGGCPRGDGTGIRTDGKRVRAEFNSRPHEKGTVSMALLEDDPDSASCQFFICNTRQRDWDGKYTVFAELIGNESLATLDRLMSTPVDEAGHPTRPLTMRSVKISDAPFEANP